MILDQPVTIQSNDFLAAFIVVQTVKQALGPLGVNVSDLAFMLTIQAVPGRSLTAIGEDIGVSPVRTNAITNRLRELSFIQKAKWNGVGNRRLMIYELTAEGVSFLKEFAGLKISI